jgi:hypothetical protein
MTGAHHCTQLLIDMGSYKLFCLGWPQTAILLILPSQVARIVSATGTWHQIIFIDYNIHVDMQSTAVSPVQSLLKGVFT